MISTLFILVRQLSKVCFCIRVYLDMEMGVSPELKFPFKLSWESTEKKGVLEGFVRVTSVFEQRVRCELSEIYDLTENMFATFDAI